MTADADEAREFARSFHVSRALDDLLDSSQAVTRALLGAVEEEG